MGRNSIRILKCLCYTLTRLRSISKKVKPNITGFKSGNRNCDAAARAFALFDDPGEIKRIFQSLLTKCHIVHSFDITEAHMHFTLSETRFESEIEFLKEKGIRRVVSLTERHHNKDALQKHFEAHHLSINDLDAPRPDQVNQLADILQQSKKKNEKVAVHCLAGVGRTSTMLMAAHMVMGESLEKLKTLIARQNPSFVLIGKQADFLHALSKQLRESTT